MMDNFSAPAVSLKQPVRTGQFSAGSQGGQEKKRLDYTHLDIIAEAERIIDRRLVPHTKTSGKFKCQCPFKDCSSTKDAFLVFDRPELEEGQVHFWCNRCGARGSLMDLVMLIHK